MANHGFTVSVYNRTTSKVKNFIEGRAKGKPIHGAYSVEELVSQLKSPKKVMIMVQAGKAVDAVIEGLIPLLDQGDIIIDGGNSNWNDTIRRCAALEAQKLLFVGAGVSGGEEGALKGPSIMPGGSNAAWAAVKPIFQAISAKVENGVPCCDWVGASGAGHYVKMVHNGIEYGDMQLISEAYLVMRDEFKISNDEMAGIFDKWNKSELDSYLIEITTEILRFRDDTNAHVIDKIMDRAGQKGTGKWTAKAALDSGIPVTLIGEAVFARCLSAIKEERVAASTVLPAGVAPDARHLAEIASRVEDLRKAVYASKMVSYAQGFALLRAASDESNWNINFGSCALMWRGGCIIRSKFLGKIKEAFDRNPGLPNLVLDPFFLEEITSCIPSWRRTVALLAERGVPAPALSSALAWYDGYRKANGSACMIQAQRDYFGAHQVQLIGDAPGKMTHFNWTGRGGTTASSTYNV
jgi:6-phosphogluconate dehydrogenase